jgi:hypothetical protein
VGMEKSVMGCGCVAWVSPQDPRAQLWKYILGDSRARLSIPLRQPLPRLADGGPFAGKEFYEADIGAFSPEQMQRLIERMAAKFNLTTDEIKRDIDRSGIPILADNVTVKWCEKHTNLDIAGYGSWDPDWEEDYDHDEEEEALEEGEINLFANMPWINQNIGSMMEAQLVKYKEPNQCRSCGKHDESLRGKEAKDRFCSDQCRSDWNRLLEVRIAQGKHDLRTRGFD